jgi:transglutaminase-like putative cysteine protease/tetratricopeptide (TPR) repeat protein
MAVGSARGARAASAYDALLATEGARLAAHPGEPAAVSALAILAGLDELVPPPALEAALRPAVAPGAHPLVAAQAAFTLAHLLDQRGETREAAALRAPLGLFAHWFVIGPFGEGRPSFGARFPPETERAPPEVGHTYPGKLREVGWRAADAAVRDGVLYLDGMLRPDTQAVAYAVLYVRSDRARAAALRLGSAGPIKVWWNGAEVLARDVVRPAVLDQDAVGVRMARGWNRLLIKTVVTDNAWRLYARLTEPSGAPLPVFETRGTMPEGAGAASRSRTGQARAAAIPVATLDALLAARTARPGKGAAAAAAWLDRGRALSWLAPRDRDAHAAADAFQRALALAPPAALSLPVLLAAAEAADSDDERRRFLERGLALRDTGRDALSPAWQAFLLTRLGELARTERRDSRAHERWQEALAVDPTCWPATLSLAEADSDAGLPLAALVRLEALPPAVQALPRVRRAAARLYEAAGRRRETDRVLEALARERRVDVDLLHQLAGRARARGDGGEARARLAAAAALRPDLPSMEVELGRLFEGAGEQQRARSTLEAVAARLPDDPGTLVAVGKLLHRLGDAAGAIERLRAALTLRPQDPELKRYLDRLTTGERGDGSASDELARRYAEDARALVPPAGQAAPPESAVVLLDRRVVRVHRNGLSRTFAQRVVQVVTDRGASENNEFAIHYTPGTEQVDVRQARVYRRDAAGVLTVLEATDRSDEDLSEPWYGLYYDNRAEVVRFEGLRPGDVLEIQYLVDDVGSENQLADYFGDLQYVADTIPKRRWDYTLIAPKSRAIHTNQPVLPRLERAITEEKDDRIYHFAAKDVAKVDSEPAMPGLGESAPYLHVSTYATWAEVGAWYWRLVEEQLIPDEEVRKTARGLVTRAMTDADRVRAIYDFVVASTRYVGLEFGIHGFKPYKVSQVLSRRFGDCKDKASLMIALLREVGVDAELVLVRTRRGGRLDPQPASLAIFDHAIVYVPKLDRYLDGTAEFAGFSELPDEDQGVMVLRVSPGGGGTLTETPIFPSTDSRVERRWNAVLAASGDATVEEQLSIRGQAAPNWRTHYQTAGERAERYGRVWTGRFPGARLTSVDMPRIADRNAPVTVRAQIAVPRFGRLTAGGALQLPVTGRDGDYVRTYARLSARRQDLVLAYPWQHEEELVYKLPPGWRLAQGTPPPRTIESPFGRFAFTIDLEGTLVRVKSALDVTRARIAADDYLRFRSFLGEIDAALAQPLVIEPPSAVNESEKARAR